MNTTEKTLFVLATIFLFIIGLGLRSAGGIIYLILSIIPLLVSFCGFAVIGLNVFEWTNEKIEEIRDDTQLRLRQRKHKAHTSFADLDFKVDNKKRFPIWHLRNINRTKKIFFCLNNVINEDIANQIIVRLPTNYITLAGREYLSKMALIDRDPTSNFSFCILSFEIANWNIDEKLSEESEKDSRVVKFKLLMRPNVKGDLDIEEYKGVDHKQFLLLYKSWVNKIITINKFRFFDTINELSKPLQSKIDTLTERQFQQLDPEVALDKVKSMVQNRKFDNEQVKYLQESVNRTDLSIKHKLKLTIPLFLFVKYEAEMSIDSAKDIPRSPQKMIKLIKENR